VSVTVSSITAINRSRNVYKQTDSYTSPLLSFTLVSSVGLIINPVLIESKVADTLLSENEI